MHMVYNNNNNISAKNKFTIPSNFLNPKKRAKPKNSYYSPKLNGCMNTHSGEANFPSFQILLEIVRSSTIAMGKLT